jgi:hypothetical protein
MLGGDETAYNSSMEKLRHLGVHKEMPFVERRCQVLRV